MILMAHAESGQGADNKYIPATERNNMNTTANTALTVKEVNQILADLRGTLAALDQEDRNHLAKAMSVVLDQYAEVIR